MVVPPGGATVIDCKTGLPVFTANGEMFVNTGLQGCPCAYRPTACPSSTLLLVNGQDDNNNGWIDEGWDGVDNNGDGDVDEPAEWEEIEAWQGAILTTRPASVPYTIQRRPVPSANAREVALPSHMVIDATTDLATTRERSRLPVNPYTGYADIVINPDGTVVPQTIYSIARVGGDGWGVLPPLAGRAPGPGRRRRHRGPPSHAAIPARRHRRATSRRRSRCPS